MKRFLSAVLDVVYPRKCEICGADVDRPSRMLCSDCLMRLPFVPTRGCCRSCGRDVPGLDRDFICEDCRVHKPSFDRAASVLRFEGEAREMMLHFKFERHLWLRNDFVDMLEGTARARFDVRAVSAIVPVPTTLFHRLDRGYNQSAILARGLARRLGVPYGGSFVRRTGRPKRQGGLSEEERRTNVIGTFVVTKRGLRHAATSEAGRAVLLLDDIMTTGSTLSECAKTLKAAGFRKVWCLSLLRTLRLAFALCLALPLCAETFDIDATRLGRTLPNAQQTIVVWHLKPETFRNVKHNPDYDVLSFAEYVEVMGATGGNPSRDCFRNPSDRSVLDDYDFSRLVEGCRGIVSLGLKPYLKLGNVPQKLSSAVSGGDFQMNIRPPDDNAAYARYMEACARALLAAFGRDELLTWRFAVLTEYENAGWFADATKNPDKTFRAYCTLYETTVRAFHGVISPHLTFGAHAMAVTEGLWDERRFLRFVAERRLPLAFVTASFYDERPGRFTSGLTLPKTIAHLRSAAESVGLTNLFYAVDEGRLLWGKTRNRPNDNLGLRIVGDTYQAAYDARLVRQLFDSNAEYFAAWGYLSGPSQLFEGLPSVSFYVARETAKFKGMRRLDVVSSNATCPAGVENGVVAALSPDGTRLRAMAYAFTNELFATGFSDFTLQIRVPKAWRGRSLEVVSRVVDDHCNWFDEWRRERKRRGIGDDRFNWSPDDLAVLSKTGLLSEADRALFSREIEPILRPAAELRPWRTTALPAPDGTLILSQPISFGGVWFLDIYPLVNPPPIMI